MSEKILVTCPGCSKQYSFEAAKALGKRATCKGCGSQFVIDGGVSKKVPSYAEELLSRASSDQSANTEQPTTPKKSEPPPIPASGEVVHKRTSTRAALAIVAAVVLLTLSAPFVAMFFGSLLFPKSPIAAVAPVIPPIAPVVPKDEAKADPAEDTKGLPENDSDAGKIIDTEEKAIDLEETNPQKSTLGFGDENVILAADAGGFTLTKIKTERNLRAYRCVENRFLVICYGNENNLDAIGILFTATGVKLYGDGDMILGGIGTRNFLESIGSSINENIGKKARELMLNNFGDLLKKTDSKIYTDGQHIVQFGSNVDIPTKKYDFRVLYFPVD